MRTPCNQLSKLSTCFSLASDISNQLISQLFLDSFYRYQFFTEPHLWQQYPQARSWNSRSRNDGKDGLDSHGCLAPVNVMHHSSTQRSLDNKKWRVFKTFQQISTTSNEQSIIWTNSMKNRIRTPKIGKSWQKPPQNDFDESLMKWYGASHLAQPKGVIRPHRLWICGVVPAQIKEHQNHLKIAMKCWDNEKWWEFHGASATHNTISKFFSSNWCEWNRLQVTKRPKWPTEMCNVHSYCATIEASHTFFWCSLLMAFTWSICDTEGGSKKSEKPDLCGPFNSFQHG